MKGIYERFTKRTLLTTIIVFFSMISFSATYYIDTKGSNSNNGSIGSPWLTLKYACDHATNAGDVIHVNPGVYTETVQSLLRVGVSIVGEGNTSVIKSNITSTNGTIYAASGTQGTSGNQSISYIKMDGSNLAAFDGVVIVGRSNFSIHHCEFVDFQHGAVLFFGRNDMASTDATTPATGNTFYNNIVTNCAYYTTVGSGAVRIGGQTGMLIHDNVITQPDRTGGTGANGYGIKYCGGGFNRGLKIYSNTITVYPYAGTGFDFAIELWNVRGGTEIYNNTIQGVIDVCNWANNNLGYSFSTKIYNNTIGFNTLQAKREVAITFEGAFDGVHIYKNRIKNVAIAMLFNDGMVDGVTDTQSNFNIYSNIIYEVGVSGLTNNGNAIYFTTDLNLSNINFNNNTIYAGVVGSPIAGFRFTPTGTINNLGFKNNIIVGFKSAPVYFEACNPNIVSLENNLYYQNGHSNTPLYSTSTVTSKTEQNNLIADPLFVSSGRDFNLQTSSPAINKGLNVGLTTDFSGSPLVGLPDIGAFEYGTSTADTEKPIVTAFTIPSMSTVLSVSISTLTATDNIGVIGYLLTETSSIPLSGTVGWSATKPTTYTFTSTGNKTLYAWAKDAAGNVSASLQANITLSSPTATTFTFTGPSSGNANSASANFTVTPNSLFTGTITVTPSGTGSVGLSPKVLTFSNSATAQTFTIIPTVAGSITLVPTNGGTLANPASLNYTVNAVAPNAPNSVVATAGDARASVTFVAPTNNGGSNITGYTVTSIPAGGIDSNAGSTLLNHSITGLTNGTTYTFTVKATNSVGSSVASAASNAVTPQAPAANNFTFTGPSSGNANSASANFTVTPNNPFTGIITVTPMGTGSVGLSPKVLTFSNSATAQTFTIVPTVSGSITLVPTNGGTLANPASLNYTVNAVVPNAPTSVVATAGDARASVTFVAPTNNGGSNITGYTVTSIPAGGIDLNAGSTLLNHSITGLTNGTTYTFTVKATNSAGSSVASVASNSVIPVAASVIIKQGEIIPSHFTTVWQGSNGLNHMNINVVSAMLEDQQLSTNDEIAVFDGSACVGVVKLTKSIIPTDNTTFVTILASQNDGSGNGFMDNDTITFKIWNSTTQNELQVNGVVYRNDVSTWKTNGRYSPGTTAVAEISTYKVYSQSIELLKGFNMISTFVSVQNPNVSTVTRNLIEQGNLIKVQDESGNSFEDWGNFGGWINKLGSLQETEGYKIQVANNCTLQVTGKLIAMPFDISLKTGWNIISFPRTDIVNAMNIVQNLIDQNKLVKVQDESGNSIENWGLFGGWKNGIGNFIPGKAYKVKMSADAILTFQESYPKSALVMAKSEQTEFYHSSVEGNGTDHMNINITGLNNIGISVGDELAAFDGSVCVATTKITEANLLSGSASLVPSFSTDNLNLNGFKSGDPIQISAWSKLSGDESKVDAEVITGQMKYEKNASVLVKMKSATIATDITKLDDVVKIDVFPNPCQGRVTVRFSEMPDANSRIEISDISGRKLMSRLISGTSEEFDLVSFTPGLYLVKSILGKNEHVQKLIVNK
jgi:hypothetical protein